METTDSLFERQLIRLSPIDHEKDPAVVSRWTVDPLLLPLLGKVFCPLSTEAVRKLLSVLDLVRTILKLMDSRLEPEILNDARNEIPAQCLTAEKARRQLGWSPLFTLEEGLRATIAWYEEYLADGS